MLAAVSAKDDNDAIPQPARLQIIGCAWQVILVYQAEPISLTGKTVMYLINSECTNAHHYSFYQICVFLKAAEA